MKLNLTKGYSYKGDIDISILDELIKTDRLFELYLDRGCFEGSNMDL